MDDNMCLNCYMPPGENTPLVYLEQTILFETREDACEYVDGVISNCTAEMN